MADPYMRDFHGRLKRIERIHKRGGGFEAAGTLGRSSYRQPAQKRSLMRPLILVLGCAVMLKAGLYAQIGPVDYAERVDRLRQGTEVEQIGAYVMQADAVTIAISDFLKELFKTPV